MTSEHDSPRKDETPEQTIARLELEAAQRPVPPAGPITPLVPRPIVVVIALGVLGVMVWHIVYDAQTASYEGSKVTILLGAIVFFILGADVSKWLRGGGSKP